MPRSEVTSTLFVVVPRGSKFSSRPPIVSTHLNLQDKQSHLPTPSGRKPKSSTILWGAGRTSLPGRRWKRPYRARSNGGNIPLSRLRDSGVCRPASALSEDGSQSVGEVKFFFTGRVSRRLRIFFFRGGGLPLPGGGDSPGRIALPTKIMKNMEEFCAVKSPERDGLRPGKPPRSQVGKAVERLRNRR